MATITLRVVGALAAATLVVTAAGCRQHPHLVEGSRLAMGSTLHLTAWTSNHIGVEKAFEEVFAEFTRLEKLMSTWIPDSDVQRVNQMAGVQPVRVSADVRDMLKTARQISEWTDGKFDVSFGAYKGLFSLLRIGMINMPWKYRIS